MSDINYLCLSGKIKGEIDLKVSRDKKTGEAVSVAQFYIEGSYGVVKSIALYDTADRIAKEYMDGKWIEAEGKIRRDKWMKTDGEIVIKDEFLVQNIGEKHTLILTGGLASNPRGIKTESSEWTTFNLVGGADRDSMKMKGSPFYISLWTDRKKFGEFLSSKFRVGDQIAIKGELKVGKDGNFVAFLNHIWTWWNALHIINGTSEEMLERKQTGIGRKF